MTDVLAGLAELAVEVGLSGSKGGCLVALAILVIVAALAAGFIYLMSTSCEARCIDYGAPTFISDQCMCRTTAGTYVDPSHPPGPIR